jgi:3-hydroxyisobutyrate dehydrogenase-like beta-hydroxyacid dehydrogenase
LRLSTFGLRTAKLEVRASVQSSNSWQGLALVLLVLSDIFRTILLPRPSVKALRLSPLLGRLFVPLWFKATERIKSTRSRQTVRASLAPLLILLALFFWVALLVLGYGLMIHADSKNINPTADLAEAVYLAGSAFFTLGVGNSVVSGSARILVVLAGLSGLASVTIGATFLLTVQQALHRREVLVLSTLTVAGRPPSGLVILETYGFNEAPEALAELFRDLEEWAADVLHSHRSDPVLAHFRSTDEDEWLAVFGAVLDAAALLLPATETEKPTAPAARMFLPIGCRTVRSLARLFAVQAAPTRDAVAREPARDRAAEMEKDCQDTGGGQSMKLGFIGLGRMGSAMAANLLAAGHELTVYNRTKAKAEPLLKRGAHLAETPGDAARGEVIITMLADDHAVDEAVFGDDGILVALSPGAIHVSMSTISVAESERLTRAHREKRQEFVSAPVFGRPDAAASAKLFIVPAGKHEAVATCQPLFDVLGQRTFPIGDKPPMANLVKLSGNFLIASVIESLGEAVALVSKGGIDRVQYVDILTAVRRAGLQDLWRAYRRGALFTCGLQGRARL